MNTELYRLEKKLKISDIKECTASEREAVERILAQGKALPEGIFRDSLSLLAPHAVLEKIYWRLTNVTKSRSSPLQLRLASLSFLYIFPKTS